MSKPRTYAGTTVTVTRSMQEIEAMLAKYGAETFVKHRNPDTGQWDLAFAVKGIPFRLDVPQPDPKLFRNARDKERARERERMRLWRIMYHHIKATLVMVTEDMMSFQQAFIAHHVLSDGRTVAHLVGTAIGSINVPPEIFQRMLPGGDQGDWE